MLTRENLHEYQETGVQHILDNTHCGLFLEMGLGKTVTTLTAINTLLYEWLDIDTVLVVAPKRVAESVWDAEIDRWAHLNGLTVSKIIGTAKERKIALKQKADIYLLGRDNVSWLCSQFGGSMLPFDMLVIDELSSFKNHKSLRFKSLRKVQPSFKRVVGLTGTPAPNGLIDLWSQMYLLDRGERLGKFIGTYRDEFFKPGQRNGHIVYNYKIIPEGEKRIHERISDICMSMKTKDYLKLPGRIDNIIEIKLTKELQFEYNQFVAEQVLSMFGEGQEITAANAAALSGKLLQFANGAIYDSDKNYHVVHDLKIEATKELIEDANGKPVLIAYSFKHDLARLKKSLAKYKPRQLKTQKDQDDWNAGNVQVMLMHPASGGHGLNLQAGGNIIVWFGNTWSLELEQQFNARLDRQGKKEVTIINKLVAVNTVEQDVIDSQLRKKTKQDGLMEAVKALIKKYVNG